MTPLQPVAAIAFTRIHNVATLQQTPGRVVRVMNSHDWMAVVNKRSPSCCLVDNTTTTDLTSGRVTKRSTLSKNLYVL